MHLHPHVLGVLCTRAKWSRVDLLSFDPDLPLARVPEGVGGAIVQYPDARGVLRDFKPLAGQ